MKVFVAILLLLHLFVTISVAKQQHTNLVIVGGTGDLARKYLWNSALDLFVNNYHENNTFSFYAGARNPQKEGENILQEILGKVVCDKDDEKCHKLRPQFLLDARYVLLKTSQHYEDLCSKFRPTQEAVETRGLSVRQIFYFSIPSSAYQSVAKLISENCRHDSISSTLVVLEKPFGLDKVSATEQVKSIGNYFTDDEVRRVDHYLAKSVTKQILNFRFSNKDKLETLLNKQYVDRVEIVMKEQIGVKGRVDFYDQTGVVRDVMQNHLTELLALVAMELPFNVSDSNLIEEHKLHLLSEIRPVSRDALITGQYRKYLEEAKEEIENINMSYLTPTFAAALLQIENPRWRDVPFIVMSGKHMDERSSFVRILFREREFCVSGCAAGNSTFTKYPRQLIFQIGHGSVPSAGILVSQSLFTPIWPSGVKELSMTSKDSTLHGQNPGDFHYAIPAEDVPAYVTVLRDLYQNVRETFVTASRVLLLWNIWDSVIKESHFVLPRMYKEFDATNLNFTVTNNALHFIEKTHVFHIDAEQTTVSTIPKVFRNDTLICHDTRTLINKLAQHLYSIAQTAVKERNIFHIAFSGGKSPILLYEELANNFPLFPWQHSHIWQVDERCVSDEHTDSNFRSLHEHLIQNIHIPYFNIHPMTVKFAGKICDPENKGDNLYESQIKHFVTEQKMDVILLGLGADGHTASLFPHSEDINEINKLVAFTKSTPRGSKDRMSLLLPLINRAREVNVLVLGKNKHAILHKISSIVSKDKEYPITYIKSTDGDISWFVDFNAWIE